jgi:hypothetical protein
MGAIKVTRRAPVMHFARMELGGRRDCNVDSGMFDQ